MSQCAVASSEAGPSSGSRRYDPVVRRCKTVGHAASTNSLPHRSFASATSSAAAHRQLLHPIQLDQSTSRISPSGNESREPGTTSPSKRGETLRAYSRQRRLFSGNDSGASTSPELLSRIFPTSGPASPLMRQPHPSRSGSTSAAISESAGLSASSPNSGYDDAKSDFNALRLYPCKRSPSEEATSSMSSTPSLTSPASTLSRSTSLHSAASERNYLQGATRYLSLNGSTDLPNGLPDPDAPASKWSQTARRWSNTVSRRMSITAWNQTLHSTTSPYLKAGLEELRSIFDVDTLGAAVDDQDSTDLEGAPSINLYARQWEPFSRADGGAVANIAGAHDEAVFDSPEEMSPVLSRQSSSENRDLSIEASANRPRISFTSQVYEPLTTHHRTQSWRKHRSLSVSNLPCQSLLDSTSDKKAACTAERALEGSLTGFSTRNASGRARPMRTPFVAVGLAALSVIIVGVCALETSIHPDAFSVPLTAFVLAQSGFALAGICGLALQKRWISDLASRLIRAHVLCQVLIALAALQSLSRTALYRDRLEQHSFYGTAAAGVLTSPRFLAAQGHATNPYMSSVGSWQDQATYVCVFAVQAALPLAFAFWAQYALASALSRATRSFSKSRKQLDEQRQEQLPALKTEGSAADGRSKRMRFNSENASLSKGSSQQMVDGRRSEGWLGFVITRLDVDKTVAAPAKAELDAAELTTRLEELARAAMPTSQSS